MLRTFGWLYGRIIGIRNSLYDRGILKSRSLGTRTISIGNITTGGTGKTPLVALVAEMLADADEKVCILTRGYGRESSGRVLVSDFENVLVDAREGGDEPVELARKLIGRAIVVADADRVAAAAWAKVRFGITSFVLDDAFQHRRAKRDLDVVCIDATVPLPHHLMLPSGRLREPIPNLGRADVIVITRSDLIDDASNFRSSLMDLNPTAPVFMARTRIKPSGVRTETRPFAFCGLGNPDSFFRSLEREGFALRGKKTFADHHYYRPGDVAAIETAAREANADVLLTTAKDFVKLERLKFEFPVRVIEIEMEIDDEERFRTLVTSS